MMKPARAHLARLLEAEPSVLLVGSAANGPEALEKIEELHPDVVFLDIEMPAMNGFEVLRHMNSTPLVVFATAYDEFAVKAFEAKALDYILKPVQAPRRGKRFILLSLSEILHITIDDKLVFAHTVKEKFLVEKTVSEMEQMLMDCGFRRISRGTLVNMEHVRELLPWFSGTWKLKLSSGEELDVSRDRARGLTDAMGI
jgi:DNA-binding LytR/AlgR family response regulator